jgi:hypothetical protein
MVPPAGAVEDVADKVREGVRVGVRLALAPSGTPLGVRVLVLEADAAAALVGDAVELSLGCTAPGQNP